MAERPYDYEEYPRHLHKAGGVFLIVTTDAERDAALAAGWSLLPPVPEAVQPPAKSKPKKG